MLYGRALTFGGSNQYVDFGAANSTAVKTDINRNFSIFALFKSANVGINGSLISRGFNSWYFRQRSDGKLEILKSGVANLVIGNTVLTANTWYSALVTVDINSTANVVIYLNGKVDQTGTFTSNFSGGKNLTIGAE